MVMLTEWRVEENYVFNNNPQGCRLGGRPKVNRWQNCIKIDNNKCKITNAIEEVILFQCPVQAVQEEFEGLLGLDLDLKFRYSAFFHSVAITFV